MKRKTIFNLLAILMGAIIVVLCMEVVVRAFADDGWQVPRMIAAMHEAEDFYFDATAPGSFLELWGRNALIHMAPLLRRMGVLAWATRGAYEALVLPEFDRIPSR